MEIIEAIYQRRAVRHYTTEDVSAATLHTLLRAAAQAPSPLNLQPWSFALFCGRHQLATFSTRIKDHLLVTLPPLYELHEHAACMNDPSYDVFHGAPVLIVICAKAQGYCPSEACNLAAQNLMLAAHGMGLGTCPVGFARAWLRMPHIRDELGIPGNHDPVFPLVIGHPAVVTKAKPRLEPDIVVWAQAPQDKI